MGRGGSVHPRGQSDVILQSQDVALQITVINSMEIKRISFILLPLLIFIQFVQDRNIENTNKQKEEN